jgi:septin family protein
MKFDYKNLLTEEQINNLSDDDLFEYLDEKTKWLKQFSKPLDTNHVKTYLVASKGTTISNQDIKTIKKLGRKGDFYNLELYFNIFYFIYTIIHINFLF